MYSSNSSSNSSIRSKSQSLNNSGISSKTNSPVNSGFLGKSISPIESGIPSKSNSPVNSGSSSRNSSPISTSRNSSRNSKIPGKNDSNNNMNSPQHQQHHQLRHSPQHQQEQEHKQEDQELLLRSVKPPASVVNSSPYDHQLLERLVPRHITTEHVVFSHKSKVGGRSLYFFSPACRGGVTKPVFTTREKLTPILDGPVVSIKARLRRQQASWSQTRPRAGDGMAVAAGYTGEVMYLLPYTILGRTELEPRATEILVQDAILWCVSECVVWFVVKSFTRRKVIASTRQLSHQKLNIGKLNLRSPDLKKFS
nr:LOW QUALITY PROTEIN: uncharacterized protein LOC128694929 [Cherax quadricarinatus]